MELDAGTEQLGTQWAEGLTMGSRRSRLMAPGKSVLVGFSRGWTACQRRISRFGMGLRGLHSEWERATRSMRWHLTALAISMSEEFFLLPGESRRSGSRNG